MDDRESDENLTAKTVLYRKGASNEVSHVQETGSHPVLPTPSRERTSHRHPEWGRFLSRRPWYCRKQVRIRPSYQGIASPGETSRGSDRRLRARQRTRLRCEARWPGRSDRGRGDAMG